MGKRKKTTTPTGRSKQASKKAKQHSSSPTFVQPKLNFFSSPPRQKKKPSKLAFTPSPEKGASSPASSSSPRRSSSPVSRSETSNGDSGASDRSRASKSATRGSGSATSTLPSAPKYEVAQRKIGGGRRRVRRPTAIVIDSDSDDDGDSDPKLVVIDDDEGGGDPSPSRRPLGKKTSSRSARLGAASSSSSSSSLSSRPILSALAQNGHASSSGSSSSSSTRSKHSRNRNATHRSTSAVEVELTQGGSSSWKNSLLSMSSQLSTRSRASSSSRTSSKPTAKSPSASSSSSSLFSSSSSVSFHDSMLSQFKTPTAAPTRRSSDSGHKGSGSGVSATSVSSAELWVDRYKPRTEAELCLHAAKIAEVDRWLQRNWTALIHNRFASKLLCLTGPSGCGKSTLVEVLAAKHGFHLLHWSNESTARSSYKEPSGFDELRESNYGDSSLRTKSKLDQFRSFLLRSRKYRGVLASLSAAAVPSSPINPKSPAYGRHTYTSKSKQIIVISEPPYVGKPELQKKFVDIINEFLRNSRSLAVFMFSDDHESNDNQCARTFGAEIMRDSRVETISCKAVNTTGVVKALNRIVMSEQLDITAEIFTAIVTTSKGDLRSAINSLQFERSLGGADGGSQSGAAKSKKRKRRKSKASMRVSRAEVIRLSSGSNPVISFLSGRDEMYSMFRSLGKILYTKRELPVEFIVDRSALDPVMFAEFLQHNSLAHTPPDTKSHEVESVSAMMDAFGDSDLLAQGVRMSFGNTQTAVPDQYCSSVACYGFLSTHPGSSFSKSWTPLRRPHRRDCQRKADSYRAQIDALLHSGATSAGGEPGAHLDGLPGCGRPARTMVLEYLPYLSLLGQSRVGMNSDLTTLANTLNTYSSEYESPDLTFRRYEQGAAASRPDSMHLLKSSSSTSAPSSSKFGALSLSPHSQFSAQQTTSSSSSFSSSTHHTHIPTPTHTSSTSRFGASQSAISVSSSWKSVTFAQSAADTSQGRNMSVGSASTDLAAVAEFADLDPAMFFDDFADDFERRRAAKSSQTARKESESDASRDGSASREHVSEWDEQSLLDSIE